MAIPPLLTLASLTLCTVLASASERSRYPNIAFGINVGGKVGPNKGRERERGMMLLESRYGRQTSFPRETLGVRSKEEVLGPDKMACGSSHDMVPEMTQARRRLQRI